MKGSNEQGAAVDRLIKQFKSRQVSRKTRYLRNLELYEMRRMGNIGGDSYYGNLHRPDEEEPDRLRLLHSAIESAKANIFAPQKPKPQFQTLGATWAARRKAYKLDRLCEGILNQPQGEFANVWGFALDWATDALINGSAVMKIASDIQNERISHQAIPHIFVFVDPLEGRNPKNFFEIAPMDRDTLIDMYGSDVKDKINNANSFDWLGVQHSQPDYELVEVQYAWRMPWGKEQPGKYVAVVGGKVIDDSDWSYPVPPFVFLHWIRHRHEFWGNGICDEGAEMVEEVSDFDLRLAVRQRLASRKVLFIPRGANVKVEEAISNEPIIPVMYDGPQAPSESLIPPFTEAELSFRDQKVRHFWDAIGISQVSAAARREQGVSSGIAIMTLNDTKAGRQLPKGQAYEQVFVNMAYQYTYRCQELYEKDPDFSIRWPGKRMLMQVKWDDASIEDDLLSVSVAPASSLPHDPAGRQEMANQLYNAGIITKSTMASLIGWPDVESELDIENSEGEYVDMLIERYLDADEETWDNAAMYQAPEAFLTNKMHALRRFASAWFRARIDQAALTDPKEVRKAEFNIKMLSRYMAELSELMDRERPQEVPPAGASQPGGMQQPNV